MKSGTTYLQELWELNHRKIAESGVLWPKGPRDQAIEDLFGWPQEGNESPNAWPGLADAIRAHSGDVVVSNEFMAGFRAPRIRKLVDALPAARVHVIITARDLARVIPSHWQTTVKNGNTHGWLEFASSACRDRPPTGASTGSPADEGQRPDRYEPARMHEVFWRHHDIAAIIRRWKRAVPARRITVVTVPPAGVDREVLAGRFGSAVGVQLTGLEQPDHLSNASLGAHSAELMRQLNQRLSDDDLAEGRKGRYGFKVALARSVLAARAGEEPRISLSQEQHDWVSRRAERMIHEIKTSRVNVQGDLGDLVPARHPAPGAADPADTSETDLLEVATHGLIGMAKLVAEMRILLKESRNKLETG